MIFPDADLDSAVDAIVFGVYFNAGECCNSGSRIIVHEDIAEAVTERVVALSRKVAFGEPLDEATKVGAIVSPEHQAKIDGYVKGAVAAGATVRLGGAPLEVPGLGGQFYQPTVVAGVTPDMAIAREEVFGPVLSVLTFRTLDEAVALANAASYGLSAGVWSENVHTCLDFARRGAGGHGLDQQLDGRLRRAALRRGEGERPGPRARPLRARGIPRGEDRADADRPHAGALGDRPR